MIQVTTWHDHMTVSVMILTKLMISKIKIELREKYKNKR